MNKVLLFIIIIIIIIIITFSGLRYMKEWGFY